MDEPLSLLARWSEPAHQAAREQLLAGAAPLMLRGPDGRLDLRGIDLRAQRVRMPLQSAQLDFAQLAGADFDSVDCTGASMRFVAATGSTWNRARLRLVDLSFATFSNVAMREADLTGAVLFQAIVGGDLRASNLTGAWLRFSDFEAANMWGARFSRPRRDLAESVEWERNGGYELACDTMSFARAARLCERWLKMPPHAAAEVISTAEGLAWGTPHLDRVLVSLLRRASWKWHVVAATLACAAADRLRHRDAVVAALWDSIGADSYAAPHLLAGCFLLDSAFDARALGLRGSPSARVREAADVLLTGASEAAAVREAYRATSNEWATPTYEPEHRDSVARRGSIGHAIRWWPYEFGAHALTWIEALATSASMVARAAWIREFHATETVHQERWRRSAIAMTLPTPRKRTVQLGLEDDDAEGEARRQRQATAARDNATLKSIEDELVRGKDAHEEPPSVLVVRADRVVVNVTATADAVSATAAHDRLRLWIAGVVSELPHGARIDPADFEMMADSDDGDDDDRVPERALAILLEKMTRSFVEAKSQVAVAIADEKRLQKSAAIEKELSAEWEKKALLCVKAGNDDLARLALVRKSDHERIAVGFEKQWATQKTAVDQLKAALSALSAKIEEAKRKQVDLVVRLRRADAQQTITRMSEAIAMLPAHEHAQPVRLHVVKLEPLRSDEVSESIAVADVPGAADSEAVGIDAEQRAQVSADEPTGSPTRKLTVRMLAIVEMPLALERGLWDRSRAVTSLIDTLNASATTDLDIDCAPPMFSVADAEVHRDVLLARVADADVDLFRVAPILQHVHGSERIELSLRITSKMRLVVEMPTTTTSSEKV